MKPVISNASRSSLFGQRVIMSPCAPNVTLHLPPEAGGIVAEIVHDRTHTSVSSTGSPWARDTSVSFAVPRVERQRVTAAADERMIRPSLQHVNRTMASTRRNVTRVGLPPERRKSCAEA